MKKKNNKSLYRILMILGAITFVTGMLELFSGSEMKDYFFPIFIGITLMGTAYINNNKKQERD